MYLFILMVDFGRFNWTPPWMRISRGIAWILDPSLSSSLATRRESNYLFCTSWSCTLHHRRRWGTLKWRYRIIIVVNGFRGASAVPLKSKLPLPVYHHPCIVFLFPYYTPFVVAVVHWETPHHLLIVSALLAVQVGPSSVVHWTEREGGWGINRETLSCWLLLMNAMTKRFRLILIQFHKFFLSIISSGKSGLVTMWPPRFPNKFSSFNNPGNMIKFYPHCVFLAADLLLFDE